MGEGTRAGERRYDCCVLWSGGKDCFAALVHSLNKGALSLDQALFITFVPNSPCFLCHPLGVIRQHSLYFRARHEFVIIDSDHWIESYRAAFVFLNANFGIKTVLTGDVFPSRSDASDYWLLLLLRELGLDLVLPLLDFAYPEHILEFIATNSITAHVSGLTARHYSRDVLGQPLSLKLLCEANYYDDKEFHLCGEFGEYHTCVTRFGGYSFYPFDASILGHKRKGEIWHLDWGKAWLAADGLALCRPSP